MMAFQAAGEQPGAAEVTRRLGGNELFCHFCHNVGNLNVMVGLTLLTRTAIDEGSNAKPNTIHICLAVREIRCFCCLWIKIGHPHLTFQYMCT